MTIRGSQEADPSSLMLEMVRQKLPSIHKKHVQTQTSKAAKVTSMQTQASKAAKANVLITRYENEQPNLHIPHP